MSLEAFIMPYVKPLYHLLTGKYSFSSWYTPYKTLYAASYLVVGIEQIIVCDGFPWNSIECHMPSTRRHWVSLSSWLGNNLVFWLRAYAQLWHSTCMWVWTFTLWPSWMIWAHILTPWTDSLSIETHPNRTKRESKFISLTSWNFIIGSFSEVYFHTPRSKSWCNGLHLCRNYRFREKIGDILNILIFNYMIAANGCVCTLLFQLHVVSTMAIPIGESVVKLIATFSGNSYNIAHNRRQKICQVSCINRRDNWARFYFSYSFSVTSVTWWQRNLWRSPIPHTWRCGTIYHWNTAHTLGWLFSIRIASTTYRPGDWSTAIWKSLPQ